MPYRAPFVGAQCWLGLSRGGVGRAGQVAERYTRAIEQLGSDKLDIRISGGHALERIARDSARDHPTVLEVLAAFIREHTHDSVAHATAVDEALAEGAAEVGRLRSDLEAAVTALGRRNAHENHGINAHLHRARTPLHHMSAANLAGRTFPTLESVAQIWVPRI